jgi:hypothetical protein
MRSEIQKFQDDLLTSVKQMRRGQASETPARTGNVMPFFRRDGFDAVAETGHIAAHHGGPCLTVR